MSHAILRAAGRATDVQNRDTPRAVRRRRGVEKPLWWGTCRRIMKTTAHEHPAPGSTNRWSSDMATSGLSGRVPEIAPRIIGVGFAAASVFNTAVVLPQSRTILRQYAEGAWLPPYRTVLRTLAPAAPAVIASVVAFEAVVAYHLLRGHQTDGALR